MHDYPLEPDQREALRKLRAFCRKTGSVLEIIQTAETSTAPQGMRWADELHQFVDFVFRPWRNDFVDMYSRIGDGPEVCDDAECDWCNDL